MNSFSEWLVEVFADDEIPNHEKYTVTLFPGKFKPPHKGHIEIAKKYLQNSEKLIMIISSKPREAKGQGKSLTIDSQDSLELLKQYAKALGISKYIEFVISPTPVRWVYEYVEKKAKPGERIAVAASNKPNEKGESDIGRFDRIKKYTRQGVVAEPVGYDSVENLSSSDMIKSLVDGDFTKFEKFVPSGVGAQVMFDKFVRKMNHKQSLQEGGNVFPDTSRINKEYVDPTIKKFEEMLDKIFPGLKYDFSKLGSIGKKSSSGDIDLGVDTLMFLDEKGNPKLKEFGLHVGTFKHNLEQFQKRARTATPQQLMIKTMLTMIAEKVQQSNIDVDAKSAGIGMLSFRFPQFDENETQTELYIQIDMMVGDQDWLNFSYYSDVYQDNVKGLHRTQLMVALFASKGYVFSHNYGVKEKKSQKVVAKNPKQAINVLNKLYNMNIDRNTIQNYVPFHNYIKSNVSEDDYTRIMDTYMSILDSTRADIPFDLQQYWIQNKDRLGLKGKFLPDDSKLKMLTESGVAGGSRIPDDVVREVADSYANEILKKYPEYISHVVTGGTKTGKKDHGDIDFIVNVKGEDKKQSKKDFAKYVYALSDDVIVPFRSEKYKGRKFYIAGELVSVLYNYKGLLAQIDNTISFSDEETGFKVSFLDLPAEKQGLASGLVRVATGEESYQEIFKRLGLNFEPLEQNEEYEFVLSGQKLSLRKVLLDKNFKTIKQEEKWTSQKWTDVQKILTDYDFNKSFEDLVKQAKSKLSDRSKTRVKGLFKSLVSVKTGERGTPKAERKLYAINLIDSL